MPFIRKYDHLFFDLDNTLWDFDVNARLAMQQAVTTLKLEDQVENFNSFYTFFEQTNTSLWESYLRQEIRQSELIRKRFEITIDQFGIADTDPEVFNGMYLQFMPTYTHLVDGALETLDYLKAAGYRIHIITNGLREVQHLKVKNSGLASYIEKITVSEEVSAPKPDKRIYQYALMNTNAKKSKSLMIGDTWETDILGAIQMGIDHIFFCRNEKNSRSPFKNEMKQSENVKTSSTPPPSNSFFIKKLEDLKELL